MKKCERRDETKSACTSTSQSQNTKKNEKATSSKNKPHNTSNERTTASVRSLRLSFSTMAPPDHLSGYEQERARNIERNNARLRALGLISALEEQRSNKKAWRKSGNDGSDDTTKLATEATKKRKVIKKDSHTGRTDTATPPSRKSRRLLGKAPEKVIGLRDDDDNDVTADTNNGDQDNNNDDNGHSDVRLDSAEERLARVKECREARQRAALEVAKAGADMAGEENPTATYEHCLMRVQTMTPKRLSARVKVIERAAGKHCVVKMAIFKSCLQDEGMWDLAKEASDALERLKGLLPPPAKE